MSVLGTAFLPNGIKQRAAQLLGQNLEGKLMHLLFPNCFWFDDGLCNYHKKDTFVILMVLKAKVMLSDSNFISCFFL